jgi:hypothetical protein
MDIARTNLLHAIKGIVSILYPYLEKKNYEVYWSRLWGAAWRLYNGGAETSFDESFYRSIDQQLTQAWNDGAETVGVMPDEMGADDMVILNAIIDNEVQFAAGLQQDIVAARDAKMTYENFQSQFGARIDLWANRYLETENRARVQFGGKTKLQWTLGPTEAHCLTCNRLDGIIAWASEWEQAQVHPQMPPNDMLECEGWHCGCQLLPTMNRRTANAFDLLTAIALKV